MCTTTPSLCPQGAGIGDGIPDLDLEAAQIIWNYMTLNHTIRKCDVILAMGSYDIRVAERAADLYLQGYGDLIVMSGNTGTLTKNLWTVPEADVFRDVAVGKGVPRERIMVERESTNTGENVKNTYRLLSLHQLLPSSILLVQKPYMERRAYATFLAQWPGMTSTENDDTMTSSDKTITASDTNGRSSDVAGAEDANSSIGTSPTNVLGSPSTASGSVAPLEVIVTSPDIKLLDYPNDDVGSLPDVIAVMLGDMQRIFVYGETGFQVRQDVPPDVERAYEYLRNTGRYTGYFV